MKNRIGRPVLSVTACNFVFMPPFVRPISRPRPPLFVPDLANQPDLADRAIIVNLPVIPASGRKYEGKFNRAVSMSVQN